MNAIKCMMIITMAAGMLWPRGLRAGDLTPPDAPGPTMHSLSEIYDQVQAVEAGMSGLSNAMAMVLAGGGQVGAGTGRILTGPSEVTNGSPVSIFYRTVSGLPSVMATVYPPWGGSPIAMGLMVEGLPGIFQRNFTADWGTGTYLIVCADGAGGSDSMRLSVVTSPDSFSSALTNLTAMVAEMSYALEYVAANTALITNMSSNVSDKLEILNARTAATSNSVAAIQSELATIRAIVEENNALLHSLTNAP